MSLYWALAVILISTFVQSIEIVTVHPQSINTTLNSTVSFTCEAIADEITFRVNDESAANADVIRKGFTQQLQESLGGDKKRRMLLAKAFKDNNNTNISCIAVDLGIVYSNYAVLTIQALLAPVKDLTATVLNGSSVFLMWSAPYTLDNVPITGYNINDDQGTLIDTVNTTEYIMTSSNDDPCNVTTVYVSGINGAGIGDSNSVQFYIAKAPKGGYPILLLLMQLTVYDLLISIRAYVDVNPLCPGEYPSSVDIIIKDSNGQIIENLTDSTLSPITGQHYWFVVNEYITLPSTVVIPISTKVTFSNLDGEFEVLTIVEFTTSVNISIDNNSICIQCYYIDNTTKLGCQLNILNETKLLYTIQLFKSLTTNKAKGCIVNISTGFYDLYIYDINENGTISTVPIDIKYQVFVPELVQPLISSTTIPMQPSSVQQSSTIIIISTTMPVIITVTVAIIIIITVASIKRFKQRPNLTGNEVNTQQNEAYDVIERFRLKMFQNLSYEDVIN